MTEKLPVWKIYRSHFISWREENEYQLVRIEEVK